ncbi:MAG: MarR family winged helix-turn-helix transcriptional regulator [Burkholderiales bacterium]|jgi:DNA-binding MarR family transcriptional regulator
MTTMSPRAAVSRVAARDATRAPAPVRPMPLHAMPGHLFRRLHQQGVALFGQHAGDVGLTPVQYAALHAIGAWPDSDQSTVGRAIACDKATVGAVVDRLQAKGLVERIADASDRRTWRLRATAEGRAQLERLEPSVAAIQRALLAPLTEAEVAQLMTLLGKLVGPLPGAGEDLR